jgi:hypothetical protein
MSLSKRVTIDVDDEEGDPVTAEDVEELVAMIEEQLNTNLVRGEVTLTSGKKASWFYDEPQGPYDA